MPLIQGRVCAVSYLMSEIDRRAFEPRRFSISRQERPARAFPRTDPMQLILPLALAREYAWLDIFHALPDAARR